MTRYHELKKDSRRQQHVDDSRLAAGERNLKANESRMRKTIWSQRFWFGMIVAFELAKKNLVSCFIFFLTEGLVTLS